MTKLPQLVQDVRDESNICVDASTTHQALYRAARALVRESLVIFATSDRPASVRVLYARRVLNDCVYMMQYRDDADAEPITFALLFDEVIDAKIDLVALFDEICLLESGDEIDIPRNAECIRGFFEVDSIRRALKIDDEERNF